MKSPLLYVADKLSGAQFLIDTGAEVSVIPCKLAPNCQYRQARELQAANGSSIATYGEVSLTLDLGLRRTFRCIFIVADINRPILGSDFLRKYGLLVDLQRCQLRDATTDLTVTSFTCDDEALQLRVLCNISSSPAASVLHEFPELIQPTYTDTTTKHSITHHIVTTGPPVHARARRLAPVRLQIAKREFEHMLELGIIEPIVIVRGHRLSIWCPRKSLVTGAPAATTVL